MCIGRQKRDGHREKGSERVKNVFLLRSGHWLRNFCEGKFLLKLNLLRTKSEKRIIFRVQKSILIYLGKGRIGPSLTSILIIFLKNKKSRCQRHLSSERRIESKVVDHSTTVSKSAKIFFRLKTY